MVAKNRHSLLFVDSLTNNSVEQNDNNNDKNKSDPFMYLPARQKSASTLTTLHRQRWEKTLFFRVVVNPWLKKILSPL